ncbi:uncharacterized protein TNCV_532511 [Trichonephila clavipes]|nr:uncharacterized protein TNCV_532511 [Trichonephila clavipes]
MKEGLIPSRYECPKCKKGMRLVERKGTIDGFEWRCRVLSKENPYFICRSVRKGMWFSQSRLSICVIFRLTSCGILEKKFQMAFLEKAKTQDLVLLAEELGQKESDKMTNIELRNIIIGSKDYEEEFVRAQLSVISEERVERETEEKIARQHAIQQLRWESELNELRLEIESIRSNVKRTSCAEDRKKTTSNYRISIARAEEHMRETSAVLMAEATIPVTTPIKEEKGMDDLRVVHVKVKGEQGILNASIDTGAQIPVVTADVVEGQSVDNKGTIQITSAFWEHEIGELKGSNMELNDLRHGVVPVSKNLVNDMLICSSDYEGLIENSQMVRNPAILREPSGEEGIINSVNSESVCSQEVVTDLLPETYTQSLMNVPNGDLVEVKINASNVQTNGQGIKESKREVAFTCVFKNRILYSNRRGRLPARGLFDDGPRNFEPWSVTWMTPELAPLSPNYYTTPTGKRFNSQQI